MDDMRIAELRTRAKDAKEVLKQLAEREAVLAFFGARLANWLDNKTINIRITNNTVIFRTDNDTLLNPRDLASDEYGTEMWAALRRSVHTQLRAIVTAELAAYVATVKLARDEALCAACGVPMPDAPNAERQPRGVHIRKGTDADE